MVVTLDCFFLNIIVLDLTNAAEDYSECFTFTDVKLLPESSTYTTCGV